jgi:hypothetical protein
LSPALEHRWKTSIRQTSESRFTQGFALKIHVSPVRFRPCPLDRKSRAENGLTFTDSCRIVRLPIGKNPVTTGFDPKGGPSDGNPNPFAPAPQAVQAGRRHAERPRDHSCGPWGSKQAKVEFQRLVGEWLASGGARCPAQWCFWIAAKCPRYVPKSFKVLGSRHLSPRIRPSPRVRFVQEIPIRPYPCPIRPFLGFVASG